MLAELADGGKIGGIGFLFLSKHGGASFFPGKHRDFLLLYNRKRRISNLFCKKIKKNKTFFGEAGV
jgi:hypothetical protein